MSTNDKLLSFIFLFLVGLSSIIAFFLSKQFSLASLQEQQKQIQQRIYPLRKKEAKLFIVNNRLKGISDILKTRSNYYATSNGILQKVVSDVSLVRLTLDSKKVSLTASSQSLLSVNNFIDALTGMAKQKEIISSLILGSISLNEKTSQYSVSLEADLLP